MSTTQEFSLKYSLKRKRGSDGQFVSRIPNPPNSTKEEKKEIAKMVKKKQDAEWEKNNRDRHYQQKKLKRVTKSDEKNFAKHSSIVAQGEHQSNKRKQKRFEKSKKFLLDYEIKHATKRVNADIAKRQAFDEARTRSLKSTISFKTKLDSLESDPILLEEVGGIKEMRWFKKLTDETDALISALDAPPGPSLCELQLVLQNLEQKSVTTSSSSSVKHHDHTFPPVEEKY